ncbi:glucokinase [Peteryoungia ipomoeae]|uniref:Glucokinase n=1 Tax=Peteryoungia ipomoeae TaxID=1210932 RepID=A0A4S8P8G3_9HYPH|nr:glucokinase [Peteryoungia ipomoeae]THV24089.1 glucokinase [Peteryoungia ipomoeae]
MAETRPNQKLPFPILIGDIGGTNARFSIIVDESGETVRFPDVVNRNFSTIDEAIRLSVLSTSSHKPKSLILALAGPIKGDEVPLTNCPWVVRPKVLMADLGFSEVLLLNDFEAQALAAATLQPKDCQPLGPIGEAPSASRVVLGPGTGLGVAGLVRARDMWFPVPGEGGHVDVGPRTARDYQIWPHLTPVHDINATLGRISAEELLSGRGLMNIYRALCKAEGNRTPAFDEPAQVSAAGLAGSDGLASEALELFATYLGRVAGDLALIFMAKGGVFLAGGISPKILPALQSGAFRKAFEDKAPHQAVLQGIATFVVTHPQAALHGLAAFALDPDAFGLSTDGRHWA